MPLTLKNFNQTTPPLLPYLCLTAEQDNSTVRLSKVGSPTSVTLEISTNGVVWSDYTFGTDISLTNIGDKVYWRNKSETPTNFSTGNSDSYVFTLAGKVAASGDVNYLLCKNSTTTLTNDYCLSKLFINQTALTQAPKLPATTLTNYCYNYMFYGTSITNIPQLPATTLKNYCYNYMFHNTSSVKLSTTQTGEYQTAYRIPTTGTGSAGTNSLSNMFTNTGGTFTGTPSINTTYYTSNTVV